MNAELKLSKFAKYAWVVLAFNILVIIWGVFLRASKSGDGCGQHWLTCNGEVIPSAPQLKTVIEFSHRLTSGLAFVMVLILLIWAFQTFAKGNAVRKTALISFIFIITEAVVGAGLVLTGNTAETLTAARPFWMIGHLTNTFILLASLCLTAWFASGGKTFNFKSQPKVLLLLGLAILGVFFVGMSGSVAALSSMLFPSATLSEGFAKDFSETSHILLRLRVSHPILSVSVGVFLIFLAGWLKSKAKEIFWVNRWANVLTILVLIQFASGALTLLTLSPIVMQIIHLFLADAVWIAFVLMSASVLAEDKIFAKNNLR
ncbi:MAG: COX15/CtaA family protein [Acidobacteria bacterium]|jgi:heme A synthase|nr:COX15/CtaA family protein [Acidobacteriota bacterium]